MVAFFALVLALRGCYRAYFLSEEERIWETVEALAEAVEDKAANGFVSWLDERYLDRGGMKKADIRRVLVAQFLRARGPILTAIVRDSLDYRAPSDSATAFFRAGCYEVDASGGRLNAIAFDFTLQMHKVEGRWLVYGHRRREISPAAQTLLFGDSPAED